LSTGTCCTPVDCTKPGNCGYRGPDGCGSSVTCPICNPQ
jgi:hypothetical protein